MKPLLLRFNLATVFAILILLNLVDATVTSMLIFEYDVNVEINLILRDLVLIYGVGALFGFKYFLISLLGILLLALKTDRHIMVATYTLWFVNAIYFCVVTYGSILAVATINT